MPEASLGVLMRAFHAVLENVDAAAVAQRLPWRGLWDPSRGGGEAPATLDSELAEATLQAYSIAFQLLNAAEENAVATASSQS